MREPFGVRSAAVVLVCVAALALGVGVGDSATAVADPMAETLPALGCSTMVATAPVVSGAKITFLTGPLEPFGVATSSDSKSAFVADASGAIYVYSLRSATPTVERVDSFRVTETDGIPPQSGVSPLGLALTPNGRYLIAASGSGAVVFNAAHLEAKHSGWASWSLGTLRSHGQGAIEAAVSPSGAFVFVTLEDSNKLAIFDLRRALGDRFRRSGLVGYVPLGEAPVGMAVSPNGRYLYVTSESGTTSWRDGTLTTIDLARAEHSPTHAIISTVSAGCSPARVAATSSSVFVTARGSDALLEFSARRLVSHPESALDGVVQVGEAPVGLALVDHNKTIVVSDSDRFATPGTGANLAIVSVSANDRMMIDGYLASGSFPRDMEATPNGRTLFVSNFGSGQVEAVDVGSLP